MFVTYRGTVLGLIGWQWRLVLLYGGFAAVITIADKVFFHEWIDIGTLPLGVMGGAIGIFVSFRTNSCYDRWWEGRRLWGQLVNTSRHLATQILAYTDPKDGPSVDEARLIVRRHVGYVHVLRCLLRAQDPWTDAEVVRSFDEPVRSRLRKESNPTHAILHEQTEAIMRIERAGRLDGFQLQALDRTIATLLDVQGGCERIKRTPFPPGYGFLATRLIAAFAILFPMGIVDAVGWATIPLTVLVCLGFALINEVGRVLEDPFTLFWPALPLAALSTTIEVNLRQRLGDTDVPAMPVPDSKGILM